ncbi:50S ribosomal protein L20 [Candidatus Marinamargulisbacteria bacterium SCGC AG-439-L15]|nr:50S ribosomal protein L20 [Candidatus Marinamargulisbacteria bacterium SCGC AG-439-L15]
MARVKRGNVARKKRKKILKLAKGFTGSLSKLYRQAKPAVFRALTYAYRDRRQRKRDFRRLWITRLNAALRPQGVSYSVFVNQLKKKSVGLNRKSLASLAYENPDVFNEVVKFVKS